MGNQVNIEINGQPLTASPGAMVIEVADSAGIAIPRFCYHKKLSVAANCRMCLVEVVNAPKPMPACATPVTEGMKVFTHSEKAISAQKAVMEFLLINHPLDCPICDQGGECELQDTSMQYGQDFSHYEEGKRSVQDKNIGPLIATEMTRCIQCTRCVRFGTEVAGMRELGATGRSDHMEIGTFIEKAVVSELSGNVIDLCPVGALTDKTYRFKARAWEMQQRATLSPHDAIGTHINAHVRTGMVMRVVPRENESINETWIADRDRYSYEGLYAEDRLTMPMLREGDKWRAIDWEEALQWVTGKLKSIIATQDGVKQVAALVSPSATVEEFYLLQKLLRGLGIANIDHRLHEQDFQDEVEWPLYPSLGMSLPEVAEVQTAWLIGADLRQEQPLLNHRLRQAALKGAKILVLGTDALAANFDLAHEEVVDWADLTNAVAAVAKVIVPKDKFSVELRSMLEGISVTPAAQRVADYLQNTPKGLVVLGIQAMQHPQSALLRQLVHLIAQHTKVHVAWMTVGGNAAGAWLAGSVPHRGPAGKILNQRGMNAKDALHAKLKAYVLYGIEPEWDISSQYPAIDALQSADCVIAVVSHLSGALKRHAHIALPLAPFFETSGTYVNVEGRWQSCQAVNQSLGESKPGWKILRVLGNLLQVPGFDYNSSQEVLAEVEALAKQAQEHTYRLAPVSISPVESYQSVMPLYGVDMLVRRASALQQTPQGIRPEVRVHPTFAKKLGWTEERSIQGTCGGEPVHLKVVYAPKQAEHTVRVTAGFKVERT